MIHETAIIGEPAQWHEYAIREDFAELTEQFQPQIDPTARIGALSVVDAGCVRPTIIGPNVHVMRQCHIGHGVQVMRGTEIASGAVIAGEVTIGPFVRIGVGAVISPYITIGSGARIGAGAVVINDVPKYAVVAGNPARELREVNVDEIKWIRDRIAEQVKQ